MNGAQYSIQYWCENTVPDTSTIWVDLVPPDIV